MNAYSFLRLSLKKKFLFSLLSAHSLKKKKKKKSSRKHTRARSFTNSITKEIHVYVLSASFDSVIKLPSTEKPELS